MGKENINMEAEHFEWVYNLLRNQKHFIYIMSNQLYYDGSAEWPYEAALFWQPYPSKAGLQLSAGSCLPFHTSYITDDGTFFSLESTKQEYGVYGTIDFRQPAVEILQENGSRLTDAKFNGYRIIQGKPGLPGLPATYVEEDDEAETLEISLKDEVSGAAIALSYTIFRDRSCVARSVWIRNEGVQNLHLLSAMSLCMDLPES